MGRKVKKMLAANNVLMQKWQRSWARLIEIHKQQEEDKAKKRKLLNLPPLAKAIERRVNVIMEDGFDESEFPMAPIANDNRPQPKHSPFESKYYFGCWLSKKGFKNIGGGAFSTVWHKKGDRVIKVGRHDDWIEYILWGHKNGFGGNYVPRVYSFKTFPGKPIHGEPNPFYVAVMEKLHCTTRQLYHDNTAHDLLVAAPLFTTAVEYKNPMAATLLDLLLPGITFFKNKFMEAFEGAGLDLHGGNFMLRSDGSFVLTDPITSVKDEKRTGVKRLRLTDLSPIPANDNTELRHAA